METAGEGNLQTKTYKQELQVQKYARIGQYRRRRLWIGVSVSMAISSLVCARRRTA
jgi:hypothetical protein